MTDSRIPAPRLLAGLQAGILAGLVSLGWFILLSYLYFQEPWALLNVLAASLRGHATWVHGFSSVTWTGLAAHIAGCGVVGMLVGWILPLPGPKSRTSLTGLMFGMVLSALLYQFFWLRFAPLLGEYVAPLAMWLVHLWVGISLSQFPRFYHQLFESERGAVAVLTPAAEEVDVPVEPVVETDGGGDAAPAETATVEAAPAGADVVRVEPPKPAEPPPIEPQAGESPNSAS